MSFKIDQGIQGAEDALHFLIAGRDVLMRIIIQREGLGECEDMFGTVITLQDFGNDVGTGCEARVPRRGAGLRVALPRYESTENAQARHPGKSTPDMGQVEMHLSQ